MVLFRLLYRRVLTKSKVCIIKLKGLFLMKNIILKQIIHLNQTQFFNTWIYFRNIYSISTHLPIITFQTDDIIIDLLGFKKTTKYQEYNLSSNPVDILLFDKIFLECDVAQGMTFKSKKSGKFQIFLWMLISGTDTMKHFEVVFNDR